MEHTKKLVLVDPRFARPSMRDKALSVLDTDISNILDSNESDDVKVRHYISALARYKNYSAPPKPVPVVPAPAPIAPIPAAVATPTAAPSISKASRPQKRSYKRAKDETFPIIPSVDEPLWRRTQRVHKKKKFGSPWIEYNGSTKKQKSRSTWVES